MDDTNAVCRFPRGPPRGTKATAVQQGRRMRTLFCPSPSATPCKEHRTWTCRPGLPRSGYSGLRPPLHMRATAARRTPPIGDLSKRTFPHGRVRVLSRRRPLEEDISSGQDRAVPASALGGGGRTCHRASPPLYGGVEPPDPIRDQDFPAEQATEEELSTMGERRVRDLIGSAVPHHSSLLDGGGKGTALHVVAPPQLVGCGLHPVLARCLSNEGHTTA